MTTKPLYHWIASTVDARLNCIKSGNTVWLGKHTDNLNQLTNLLPSGSGINNGTQIDLDKSTGDKLVLHTAFHHMDEHGYYAGWTEHTVTVTASLIFTLDIRVSGRNRNEIKDYLAETFMYVLMESVDVEYDADQDEVSYTFAKRAEPDGSPLGTRYTLDPDDIPAEERARLDRMTEE
jgi:hypothetical protein